MLLILLLVFLGGSIGSLARELLSPLLPQPWPWFPTLLINLTACLLIGWAFTRRDRWPTSLTHLTVGGFCGGFSTFSHFALELVTLADQGSALEAAGYVAAAMGLGIGVAMLGEWLGEGRP